MPQMLHGELKVSNMRNVWSSTESGFQGRPCPFYQQGRCVFEQSCNFVHDVSVPVASSSSQDGIPELLYALRDVLDPPDSISLVPEHGTSPHISGEGWTLVNDTSMTKDSLLSPVSLPDLKLSRLSSLKNDSFDSGYASEFSSPQPLPSTLNLLASPFGSPSSRVSITGSRLFARSPLSPGFTSPMSNREDSPDLDSPSTTRRGSASTITPAEEEEDDDDAQYSTAQWSMSSDTTLDIPPNTSRFSTTTLSMSPDTTLHNPPNTSRFSTTTLALTEDSCSGSESDEDEAQDPTAHLAYLGSPMLRTFPPDENDTINTLYDVYLHSPPQPTVSEEDREPIRARVFTPPPPSGKSNPRESTPPITRRSEVRCLFSDDSSSSDFLSYRVAPAFRRLRSLTRPNPFLRGRCRRCRTEGQCRFRSEATRRLRPKLSRALPNQCHHGLRPRCRLASGAKYVFHRYILSTFLTGSVRVVIRGAVSVLRLLPHSRVHSLMLLLCVLTVLYYCLYLFLRSGSGGYQGVSHQSLRQHSEHLSFNLIANVHPLKRSKGSDTCDW